VQAPDRGALTLLVKAAAIDIEGRAAVLAGLVDITRRKAEQTSLEKLASTDALTGLRNRLSFFAAGRAEMLRAARARSPIALLMIDIDHFKRINDSRGHAAGDTALRAFAALCTDRLGPRAIVGRLGGEEFGALLPQTGLASAALVAEDLPARGGAAAAERQHRRGGDPPAGPGSGRRPRPGRPRPLCRQAQRPQPGRGRPGGWRASRRLTVR
jgi:diguanylate cyclase (GGDEF)-like protein